MKKAKLIPFKLNKTSDDVREIPYGVNMIQAPKMWEAGIKGKGVVIGVIDTGCDINHPCLSDRIISGYNFTSDNNNDTSNYNDTNGHGTHVSGIIAANMNNDGVVGVAPESKLLILKALSGDGTGEYTNIVNAIKYSINWKGPRGEKIRVLSMSLGVSENIPELHEAIKEAVKNNILVVCSSGNSGDGNIESSEVQYPGCYPEVLEVGAVDIDENIASFSSTNNEVDIYAPGVNILSTFLNSTFAKFSGTSMAVPHVSGAVALIIEAYEKKYNRSLSVPELFSLLCFNSKPITNNNEKMPVRLLLLKA